MRERRSRISDAANTEVIIESETSADDGFSPWMLKELIGGANARGKIGVCSAVNRGTKGSELNIREVGEPIQSYELLAAFCMRRRVNFPSQTVSKRESGTYLPVILSVKRQVVKPQTDGVERLDVDPSAMPVKAPETPAKAMRWR